MTPSYSYMENSAGALYETAMGFASATAVANSGGADTVWLYDTLGYGVTVITPTEGYMQNSIEAPTFATAVGFATTRAVADSGGADTVWMYCSAGNNSLFFCPTNGSLSSPGQVDQFSGFQDVNVVGTGSQDSATLLDSTNAGLYVGSGSSGRLSSLSGIYVLNLSAFNNINLSGTAGGLHVITLTNLDYTIADTGFVSSSTFVTTPLTRVLALPILKQLAEKIDPALATTSDPTMLAILLRNDVGKGTTVGVNTAEWTGADAYEGYVQAIVTGQQPLICGGTQILYTDLLDAFGLQARYVDLFGATPAVGTHASVEVMLNNKWVAMDPTFNVSFMGANGQRLSFADIQAGVPFTVSSDGMTANPQLAIQNYPITIQQFCYRITYPPTVKN